MDFRFEVQVTLQQKLRHYAAPELQLITYQSTSWASPSVLSDYSSNKQINVVSSNLTSESCPRNATDPETDVTQNVSTVQPARAPKAHQFNNCGRNNSEPEFILRATKHVIVTKILGKMCCSFTEFPFSNCFRNKNTILITLNEYLIVSVRRGS
jgi:hypothetical protein